MNQYLAPEVAQPSQTRKKIIIYSIAALVLLVVGAFGVKAIIDMGKREVAVDDTSFLPPVGVIFYTATPKDGTISKLYAFDPNTTETREVEGNDYIYSYTKAKNGATAKSFNKFDGTAYVLFSKNGDDSSAVQIIPEVQGWVGRIALSDDASRLVYERIVSDDATVTPEKTTLVLYDTQTGIQKDLTIGINPTFYDNGRLAYLKSSGVYEVPLTPNASSTYETSQMLAYEEGGAQMDSKMIFSPDKKTAVITHPQNGRFDIHTVSNDSGKPILDKGSSVPGRTMVSPVASPSGRFITFFSPRVVDGVSTVAVVVVNFETGKEYEVGTIAVNLTRPVFINVWE